MGWEKWPAKQVGRMRTLFQKNRKKSWKVREMKASPVLGMHDVALELVVMMDQTVMMMTTMTTRCIPWSGSAATKLCDYSAAPLQPICYHHHYHYFFGGRRYCCWFYYVLRFLLSLLLLPGFLYLSCGKICQCVEEEVSMGCVERQTHGKRQKGWEICYQAVVSRVSKDHHHCRHQHLERHTMKKTNLRTIRDEMIGFLWEVTDKRRSVFGRERKKKEK